MEDTMRMFDAGKGKTGFYYSLPALEEKGLGKIFRLPRQHSVVCSNRCCNCWEMPSRTEKDVGTLRRPGMPGEPRRKRFPSSWRRHAVSASSPACRRSWLIGSNEYRGRQLKKDPRSTSHWCPVGSGGQSLGAGGLLRFGLRRSRLNLEINCKQES